MSASASDTYSHEYALISSHHNGLSVQHAPAYGLTLRVTPEILEAIADNKHRTALSVKLGATENVLTVDGATHSLRSFDEKPTVCESYVEDDDRFFQVSKIYKKLIVQRDFHNRRHVEAPKPTTERASLGAIEAEKAAASKRRRGRSDGLPRSKKPFVSSSGNLRLLRNSNSTPAPLRASSDLNRSSHLNVRSNSLSIARGPEVRNHPSSASNAKLDRPNLPLSRPNSQPLPASGTKSPVYNPSGSEANLAPSVKRKTSQRRPGHSKRASMNTELSLTDKIVHLLAIQPLSSVALGKKLGLPGKKFEAFLRKVASYDAPGKYYIKPQYLSGVDLDNWPYTDDEREKVLAQCETHNVTLSSKPDGSASESKSVAASGKGSTKSNEKRETAVPTTTTTATTTTTSKTSSSAYRDVLKALGTFQVLRNDDDYSQCRSAFEEGYPVYRDADERLNVISRKFETLSEQLDRAKTQTEKDRVRAEVKASYRELQPEFLRLKEEFSKLHSEIDRVKKLIKTYVDDVMHE